MKIFKNNFSSDTHHSIRDAIVCHGHRLKTTAIDRYSFTQGVLGIHFIRVETKSGNILVKFQYSENCLQ